MRLLPYRDFCREEGCTEEDCFNWFGKDASSIRCGTRFLILYNEKQSLALRIRFSVAHELGHILLGHHAETDEEKRFDRELYEIQEEEANCFARNLLCPARALEKLFRLYDYHTDRAVNGAMRIVWQSCRRLTDRTNSQLSDTALTERAFLLTPTAAEMRLRTLHADLRLTDSRDDRELLRNIRFTATVRCRECGAPWVPGASACYACGTENTPDARYCLRCGKPTPFERFHAFDIAVQRQERAMARNILALYATRGIYYEWDNGPGQGEPF